MKKLLIGSLIIGLLLIIGNVCYRINASRIITLKMLCITEMAADEAAMQNLCYRNNRKYGTEFTWWDQLYDEGQLAGAIEKYGLASVKVDYNTQSCIISFGRKIDNICYYNNTNNVFGGGYIADVTFAEEYQENMAYIYATDKVNFVPGHLTMVPVYKMVNGERVLWGHNLYAANTSM